MPDPTPRRQAVRHDPIQVIIEAVVVGGATAVLAGVTVAHWVHDSRAAQPRSLYSVGENVADDHSVTRLLTRTGTAEDSGPRVIIGNRPGPNNTWNLALQATTGTEHVRSIQARVNGETRPLTLVPASGDQPAYWTLNVPCSDFAPTRAMPVEVIYRPDEGRESVARVMIDTRPRALRGPTCEPSSFSLG